VSYIHTYKQYYNILGSSDDPLIRLRQQQHTRVKWWPSHQVKIIYCHLIRFRQTKLQKCEKFNVKLINFLFRMDTICRWRNILIYHINVCHSRWLKYKRGHRFKMFLYYILSSTLPPQTFTNLIIKYIHF
jgi:hypothetical protein